MRMIGNPEYNQEEKRQKVSNRIEKKLLYGSGGLVQASDSGRPQQGKHTERLCQLMPTASAFFVFFITLRLIA